MTDKPKGEGDKKKLEALIAEYLDQLDSGKRLDTKKILEEHPDCGLEIIESLQQFIDLGEGVQDPLQMETLGDYKVVKRIGQGGMGAVYEAEQISINRNVALKVLNRASSTARFKREVEAIGRLNHPGIVVLYEAGQHEGLHFFAQELVEKGFTLADDLREKKEKGDYPSGYFREVAKLIAQVADALQHAHEANVIHRDLKPSNILLTPDGKPKVTDFGLAKVMDASAITRSGKSAGGTAFYMSPEQAESGKRKIDKRTDIFSLGVTLYEMLTLKQPFVGETSIAVMRQIITLEPEEPHRLNPRAPRDLSVISQKAMEKAPEMRYQSMKEFSEDLNRFLSGDVILAKPAGVGTRFRKWVKRNPVTSFALSAFAVLVVIVPWMLYMNQQALAQIEKENGIKLSKEIKKADAAKALADSRYEEIKRLSDVKLLSDLQKEADNLWPAHPENIQKLGDWIAKAEDVLSRKEEHQRTLAALRKLVIPLDEKGRQKDRESHPQWETLVAFKDNKRSLLTLLSIQKEENIKGDKDALEKIEFLNIELQSVEKKIIELEETVSERRTWKFEDKVNEWRYQALMELLSGLDELSKKKTGLLDDIKARFEFASTIQQKSIKDYQKEWDEARASIANIKECPQYKGFKLKEQIGFAPIGRDPDSGLWEFLHLQTGEIPIREQNGKLRIKEEMGLIFVLIPGGSFNMGARKPSKDHPLGSPNVDPLTARVEAPVHSVTLKPFFLSKYEMTQRQWEHITGNNPSYYEAGQDFGGCLPTLLNPVEQVSWEECVLHLSQLKLRLPTESEWEYAARAGTTTIYWTGDEKESIGDKKAGNILDLHCKKHAYQPDYPYELWLDDGHTIDAPIGSYAANAFGLHDVLGNVFEWCHDRYGSYKNAPLDGSPSNKGAIDRATRGGSWFYNSKICRSACRGSRNPRGRFFDLGVRPAYSCGQ